MYTTHINSTRNDEMRSDYKFYKVGIMQGDKVVKELPNVMARSRQEAIHNAWSHIDAQPFRDGKHTMAVYA